MGLCRDCKWWGDKPMFVGLDQPHECLNQSLKAEPCCEGGDAFGRASSIATEPDFGCVQFELSVKD